MRPIYLDYAATTPAEPAVIETMLQYLGPDANFGNPASETHLHGVQAKHAVETAREQVANLLGAYPDEIIWTSGATEATNLAIKGSVKLSGTDHIVTASTEHKATLDTCGYLEELGVPITYVPPGPSGEISPDAIRKSLRPETKLVTLMHVNNETGVVTDIEAIAGIVVQHGALFHVDAAQSAGHLAIDTKKTPVSLLSISGHKIYGPKGVGVLFARRGVRQRLQPLIHGGAHEDGLRSGTLPTHQITGIGKAAEIVAQRQDTDQQHQYETAEILLRGISEAGNVTINGGSACRVPGIVNLTVHGVAAEALIAATPELSFSQGSACNATSDEPSHVLVAMGLNDDQAHETIRLSVGRFTTARDADRAGKGEEASPQGLGSYHLLAQPDAPGSAGQIVGHHLDGQPGGVGGEAS